MKVLILAFAGNRNGVVMDDTRYLIDDRQAEVKVVTVMPRRFVDLDPQATIVNLEGGETRLLINRIERKLLVRTPRAISGVMVKVRGLTRPGRLIVGLAWTVHVRLYRRFYLRVLRPLMMIRIAGGTVFSLIEQDKPDLVVICDAAAVPVGWKVARRYPELAVSFSVERAAATPEGAKV